MEDEVKGYKSLMMSQIHSPFIPPPAHHQNIISAIAQPAAIVEQDSAPAGVLPPPPPPPPPPGPGAFSTIAKSVAKKTKSNAEREKQLLEIIAESELHRSKHKEAVAMYLHVFLEELKKEDILDRLLDHYPRLMQACAATPRAAAVRMAAWERQLFKKLTPQELTKERKNQEWHILKLTTKEEISAHVTHVFAKIEAARKAEAEKRLKEQQSSKMTNVVEELKGLLQSRIVDAPPAPGSDLALPVDVELAPGDLSLSSSV
jgi:cell division protein FtsL